MAVRVAAARLFFLALVFVASSGGIAHAEPDTKQPNAADKSAAQILFDEGRDLVKEGQHAKACPKFAESMRLDPQIGTQMNLGACYEKIGKIASAWINFHDAEIAARRANQEKRAVVAAEHAAALEPRLSRIAIEVPDDVATLPGVTIERDGQQVRKAQWSSAMPVDPGMHTISAIATGKQRWEKRIEVEEEAATYRVTVPRLADAPTQPARSGTGQRVGGGVLLGLGVVGIAVGTGLGVIALKKNSASKQHCLPNDVNQCRPEGIALRDTAIAFGNGSTAAIVVGSALTVTGLVVVLTAPSAAREKKAAPTIGLSITPTSAEARMQW